MPLEKMRDQQVKQIFRPHPRYHRLNIEFDSPEPRLDNMKNMSELWSKIEEDSSITTVIDNISRCATASLFYIESGSLRNDVMGKT